MSVKAHVFSHGDWRVYLDYFGTIISYIVVVVLVPVLRRRRQNYLSRSLLVDMLWSLLIASNHEGIKWSVNLVLLKRIASVRGIWSGSMRCNLVLQLFNQESVCLSGFKKCVHAVVLFISMKLDLTSGALHFHPWALEFPVFNDLVLVGKVIGVAQLTVGLKSGQLAFLPHVVLKLVVIEGLLAQTALESLSVQP